MASLPERLCGERFGLRQLAIVRELIVSASAASRAELARRVCAELGWINAAGRPKAMSARVALLRLARGGWIELPPPRKTNGNGRWHQQRGAEPGIEQRRLDARVDALDGLRLERVEGYEASHLWNALISRHHYLGYTPLVGAQVRYLIRCSQAVLGCLGFGAAAWKVAARDRWIGWDAATREVSLPRLLNNARFLILPWVRVENLASCVLSLAARKIRPDFEALYGIRVVLLETFVDRERHHGTSYRAANWHWVGITQGRGKLDRLHHRALPVKDIYVYPLEPDFRRSLGVMA